MIRRILALLAAAALFSAGQAQAAGPARFGFSPVNQYGINITAAYWNPIINYVSEKSGVALELKIGRTSADTTAFVLAEEVGFVFTNHLFSPEREKLGWKVFGRRVSPPVHSQIVVPEDSPVKRLDQLNGEEVGFPGPEALVAYKFSYAHLLSQGIAAKPVFTGNMDAAFVRLFNNKVAAVGANSQLLEGYASREGKKYRVLWSSPPLFDLALMVSGKVPEKDARAVSAAFLGMHKDVRGRAVLDAASQAVGLTAASHFIPSDGSEYGAYRDFFRTAPPQLR